MKEAPPIVAVTADLFERDEISFHPCRIAGNGKIHGPASEMVGARFAALAPVFKQSSMSGMHFHRAEPS